MSDNTMNSNDGDSGAEQPKLSQAEAIKRILEKKKAQQQANGQQGKNSAGPKSMKTQIHKVQNNQKRRTGV